MSPAICKSLTEFSSINEKEIQNGQGHFSIFTIIVLFF